MSARRRPGARALLAVPSLAWTTVFFLAPLALLAVYSLGQIDIITFQVDWGWTTESYRRIGDHLYLDPIIRSVVLSASATVACLLVGFPVALWISRLTARQQTLALVAVHTRGHACLAQRRAVEHGAPRVLERFGVHERGHGLALSCAATNTRGSTRRTRPRAGPSRAARRLPRA